MPADNQGWEQENTPMSRLKLPEDPHNSDSSNNVCRSFCKTNLLYDGPDPLQLKATFHLQERAQIHVQLLKLQTVTALVAKGVIQPDDVELVRAQILDPVESRHLGGMCVTC